MEEKEQHIKDMLNTSGLKTVLTHLLLEREREREQSMGQKKFMETLTQMFFLKMTTELPPGLSK